MNTLSAKTIIAALLIAKAVSLVAALSIFGLDDAQTDTTLAGMSAVSHIVSFVLFVAILCAIAKRAPQGLVTSTQLPVLRYRSAVVWALLCIPFGLVVRFGTEGIYLAFAYAYSPAMAFAEFDELVGQAAGTLPLWLLVSGALVAAADEEFVYRRIMLWRFIRSYGVWLGVMGTSAIFSIPHLNPVAGMAGICLALLYLVSGRLWVAVAVHAVGNLAHPLLRPLVSAVNWSEYFAGNVAAAVALSVVLVWCVIRIRKSGALWRSAPARDTASRALAK